MRRLADLQERVHKFDTPEPEYDQEGGDIATENHRDWYQYGKLYFQGDEKGLVRKMEKDSFFPNVFSISDHGNAHLVKLPRLRKTMAPVGERIDVAPLRLSPERKGSGLGDKAFRAAHAAWESLAKIEDALVKTPRYDPPHLHAQDVEKLNRAVREAMMKLEDLREIAARSSLQ
jgi:hypothetical protein